MTNQTKALTKAPFKADHVGSLLRPENLHIASAEFKDRKYNRRTIT